jgi:hypothetical protein
MVLCEKLSVAKLVMGTDFWVIYFSRVFPFPILKT